MLAELVRRLVDAYQAASMHQLLDTLVGKFEKRAGVADAHTEFFCQRHRGLPQERLGLGLNVTGPFTRLLGFSHLRDQLLVEVKLRHELRGLARFPGCLQCIPDPAQHLLDAAPLRMNPLDSLRACYPPPRFIEFQFNREGPPRLPPRRHWFHLLKVDRASTKANARPGTAPGRIIKPAAGRPAGGRLCILTKSAEQLSYAHGSEPQPQPAPSARCEEAESGGGRGARSAEPRRIWQHRVRRCAAQG